MQVVDSKSRYEIMAKRKMAMFFSIALVVISLLSLATRGLELGIDFTGGYLIEVGYDKVVELEPIRQALAEDGYQDTTVQHFGSAKEVLVRLAPREGVNSATLSDELLLLLQSAYAGEISMRRVEFVGPQVGEELQEQGGLAVLYALIGILIYVALRFEKRFSVGAVTALIHDVIITLGVFSVLQFEFDLSVLAALLAVIGYSLNDTIVVFDRIRENFRKMRTGTPEEVIDRSINQTLSRTIITSLTTLLVLLALFILGGEVIAGFSLALIVGVVVGTYSSIFVASTSLIALGLTKQDLMPVEKEGADLDESP
ncbi:MAG: protein translocase subunit SecF [Gammaproteobacteria bacterium]|nr:protein translocase subunit SecF [Gammaproteobacteria bacterium]